MKKISLGHALDNIQINHEYLVVIFALVCLIWDSMKKWKPVELKVCQKSCISGHKHKCCFLLVMALR